MKQFLSNRRREAHMNWFESATDWEQELERCGATGWRVSSVNDRFEMSTRYVDNSCDGLSQQNTVVKTRLLRKKMRIFLQNQRKKDEKQE